MRQTLHACTNVIFHVMFHRSALRSPRCLTIDGLQNPVARLTNLRRWSHTRRKVWATENKRDLRIVELAGLARICLRDCEETARHDRIVRILRSMLKENICVGMCLARGLDRADLKRPFVTAEQPLTTSRLNHAVYVSLGVWKRPVVEIRTRSCPKYERYCTETFIQLPSPMFWLSF